MSNQKTGYGDSEVEWLLDEIRSGSTRQETGLGEPPLADQPSDGFSEPAVPGFKVPERFLTEFLPEPEEQTGRDNSFTNDIQFDTKFRGYDRLQVDHYIDAITGDYNAICEKCAALEEENESLRRAIAQLTINN